MAVLCMRLPPAAPPSRQRAQQKPPVQPPPRPNSVLVRPSSGTHAKLRARNEEVLQERCVCVCVCVCARTGIHITLCVVLMRGWC